MEMAYFTQEAELLVPTELARGSWSADSIHGVALCGALGRAAERTLGHLERTDLRPSRMTVDLFAAPRFAPCVLATEVVRDGPRICLIDVQLTQAGKRVARASVQFLKPTEAATGEVWAPSERPASPPVDVVPPSDEPRVPFIKSDSGWSQNFAEHQDAGRKAAWYSAARVVASEPVTPFQAAASTADAVNFVTNWGSRGVEHINTDVTLALSRLPVGTEVGLIAMDRVDDDGIAVSSAAMFDREGQLGIVTCTVIANARRTVDMGSKVYSDDPRSS